MKFYYENSINDFDAYNHFNNKLSRIGYGYVIMKTTIPLSLHKTIMENRNNFNFVIKCDDDNYSSIQTIIDRGTICSQFKDGLVWVHFHLTCNDFKDFSKSEIRNFKLKHILQT